MHIMWTIFIINFNTKESVYLNGQSFFNIKMKNEKQILAVAHFFLQIQKASSKTRFGLNKIYLRITSSFQILTLLAKFQFSFFKMKLKNENWNHFSLWWFKEY